MDEEIIQVMQNVKGDKGRGQEEACPIFCSK